MMNNSNAVDFLKRNVKLFGGFPGERLEELVGKSRIATFEPNEFIIEFAEEGRFLGVLLEGEAEVSVTDDSGHKRSIAVLKQGDIFGEASVMTGDKTTADVVGRSRCTVLLIPEDLFSACVVSNPAGLKYLSRLITERSRSMGSEESRQELVTTAYRRSEDPYGFKLHSETSEKLLVINSGSSSLKYNLYDTADEKGNARGAVERIGASSGMRHIYKSAAGEVVAELPAGTHREAFAAMLAELASEKHGVIRGHGDVTVVGHRVVHGGEKFSSAEIITDDVLKEIENLSSLAPLHNPINALGIREARRVFTTVPHVAVFDTCFHHTLPPFAYLYGLPYSYYEDKKIRRYGFHGTSHFYVALKAAEYLKQPFNALEVVSCHLGNGASLCAIDHGRSVDTSMGFTPVEGLIMGTRCGDLDPAILLHLMRTEKMTPEALETLLQKESGLLGISGVSNDMREILTAAEGGNHRALLAFKTFCYRVRKYIGAYVAAMGGLDVIVFTGGIGQGSAGVRTLACQGLGYMGIRIDEEKNRNADGFKEVCCVSEEGAPVKVLVVPTDEERMIARETLQTLKRRHIARIIQDQKAAPITVEVSAHHVHLSQEHVEVLFGAGHQLTPEAELSQPGQYACKEKVTLVGPKGRVERVRVLGPVRKMTQVEISMTEQFSLGIHPPIRESGDLEGTPGMVIEGSAGSVKLEKGVICAYRHIHMSPENALKFGLRDKYNVRVRVEGNRELIFGDVLVRVNPNFRLAMHVDTDEANAAGIKTGDIGYIDAIQSRGT